MRVGEGRLQWLGQVAEQVEKVAERAGRATTVREFSAELANVLGKDLGSTNGTFVNERRVSGTHVLRHGYVLRIGNTVFDVHLTAAADATAQMPVPPPTYPDDAPTNGSRRLIPIVLGVLAAAVALL